MAWGDAQDYWWLKPKQDNTAAEMQMGAQLRRAAVQWAREKQEKALEARRTGIAIQKHFDDEAIKNKILDGDKLLTSIFAETTDWSDKTIPQKMGQIAVQHPYVTQGDMWKSMLKFHETAVAETDKYAAMEESRKTREEIAANTAALRGRELDARIDRWQAQGSAEEARLDMMAKHYGNQDEIARARLKLYAIDSEQNREIKKKLLTQHDLELERLEERLKFDKEKYANKESDLSPGKRQAMAAELKSLELKYMDGGFLPDGVKNVSKATPEQMSFAANSHMLAVRAVTKKYFGERKSAAAATPAAPSGTTAPIAPGSAANLPPPKRGDIVDGYRYKGGGVNPGDPASWEKVD